MYIGLNSFHQATVSFASQNYGAGKYKRINKVLICALLCVIVVGTIAGNLIVTFGETLLGIYSSSGEVIEAGLRRLNVAMRVYALCGMMDVAAGAVRGIGYSILPTVVSLIGVCGMRVFWIYVIFAVDKWHTTTSLYVSYPVTWTLTFVTHMICYILIKRKLDKKEDLQKSLQ